MVSGCFFGRFRTFASLGRAAAAVCVLLLAAGAGKARAAHFHHVQLNVDDPFVTAAYFVERFRAQPLMTQGFDGSLRTGRSYLFLRTNAPKRVKPGKQLRAFWHIGWGCVSIERCYSELEQSGAKIHTPLTEISPGYSSAYVESPDGALIELSSFNEDRFGQVHLYSADPWAAGDWYQQSFGMQRSPRKWLAGPDGARRKIASLHLDGLNLILYPPPAGFKGKLVGSEDGPLARIGFSFDDYDDAVKRFREEGSKVSPGQDGQPFHSVTVEGPDGVLLEIVDNSGFPAGR